MSAIITGVRRAAVIALAALSMILAGAGAYAGTDDGGDTSGSIDGSTINAKVSVTGDTTGVHKLGSGKSTWKPPLCYWVPFMTGKQLKPYYEDYWARADSMKDSVPALRKYYVDENNDFHATESGWWWQITTSNVDPSQADNAISCINDPKNKDRWIPDGGALPDPVDKVTPKMLADSAARSIGLPATAATISPADKQTVNLPTWVWANPGDHERSVTATITDDPRFWATVTARPVQLILKPNAPSTSISTCDIKDGTIGQPWSPGKAGEPPCGFTYRNAGRFPLTIDVVWEAHWTSYRTGDQLLGRSTVPGTPVPQVVQEIQAIVGK